MAADHHRRNDRSESLPDVLNQELPRFFKIVLNPRSDKLRIPPEFTRRFGGDLPNDVSLMVPSGAVWTVEVTHGSDAEAWMCKGWAEFREHYSVGLGHLLLFDYDGNSCFNVHMFDTSATEIEYSQYDPCHGNESPARLPSPRKAEKISSHVKRRSRIITSSPYVRSDHAPVKLDAEVDNEDSLIQDLGLEPKRPTQKIAKYLARERALASMSHELDSSAYCVVVMHPTYTTGKPTYLSVPSNFAKRSFPHTKNNNMTLRISGGRTWPVKCTFERDRAKVSVGWRAFVEDNLIKTYDACLFQVDHTSNLVWNVTIFRC